MSDKKTSILTGISVMALVVLPTAAGAQVVTPKAKVAENTQVDESEIVVTANKREQSIKDVGMTIQAASAETLAARGIEGLLCFGSPDFNQEFPAELDGHAVVTVGLSIRTPLHRVTSHFYNNTLQALNRVHALGYRRPGLVLGTHEDTRSASAHASAYLGWCEHELGSQAARPILRLREVEEPALTGWLVKNRPDVVVFVHLPEMIPRFRAVLKRLQISIPKSLGVVVLSHEVEGTGFAGLRQNQLLMGSWAVELLAARIANHDLGIPVNPRTEMVESEWVNGDSLRKR